MGHKRHSKAMHWLTSLVLLFPVAALSQELVPSGGPPSDSIPRQPHDTTLLRRWVGWPLTLEFYGDTMLVVGDHHALDYRLTSDSLVATGDTSIRAQYRLSHGRLLLDLPDGSVITMATQKTLARPLTGHWIGALDSLGSAIPAELNLNADRSACWHVTPDGKWLQGEWDRQFRQVTMTWDNNEWIGIYDPQRNSILLRPIADSTHIPPTPGGSFQRVFRGPNTSGRCPAAGK